MNDRGLEAVQERLEEWAEWYSRGQVYGLGYPSCSLAYRIMASVQTNRQGGQLLLSNSAAEEIESWVCEMTQHNALMALALRAHYFYSGSLRAKAGLLKISHTQFKFYLGMAEQWLAGRLSSRH